MSFSADTGKSVSEPITRLHRHLPPPDGSRLIVAVVGAVASPPGGDQGSTRLVVLGPDRRVRARGDLDALLRRAGLG